MYYQGSSDEDRPEHKPFSLFKGKEACGHLTKSSKSSGKHWQRKQVSSSGKSELSSAGVKSDSNYSKIKVRKEKCVEASRE